MSSFLFLTFCVYVFCCSGLHFSAFILLGLSFGGFLQLLLQISTRALHGFHRAGNPSCWCRFPSRPPKPHTGPHGGEFGFSPQNEFTPPPKGGGAGYRLSGVGRVCPARSQPGHVGPTGPVWSFGGVGPYPALKTAHRAAQSRVWFHRFFFLDFLGGSPASWRSRW